MCRRMQPMTSASAGTFARASLACCASVADSFLLASTMLQRLWIERQSEPLGTVATGVLAERRCEPWKVSLTV